MTPKGHSPKDWAGVVLPALLYVLYSYALHRAVGRTGAAGLLPLGLGLCGAALLWTERARIAARKKSEKPLRDILFLSALGVGLFLAGRLFGEEGRTAGLGELFCVCIAAPLCEELVYRGLVLDAGRKCLGETGAVLLSSLLFAAAHGTAGAIGYAALGGIVLGSLDCRTKNIFAAVYVHALANILSCL